MNKLVRIIIQIVALLVPILGIISAFNTRQIEVAFTIFISCMGTGLACAAVAVALEYLERITFALENKNGDEEPTEDKVA